MSSFRRRQLQTGAGKYRHRINIQRPVRIRDETTAGWTTTWVNLYSDIPASIEPLSARDFVAAGAQQNSASGRIEIRFLPGIPPDARIANAFTDQVYRIIAPLSDPRSGREHITFVVSEWLQHDSTN